MAKKFYGLSDSAKAWLIAKFYRNKPFITVVCKDRQSADNIVQDLGFFLHGTQITQYPAWDCLPFEKVSPQLEISAARVATQLLLKEKKPHVIVATIEAITQKVLKAERLTPLCFNLDVGLSYNLEELRGKFAKCGYKVSTVVEDTGEISFKGAVIDFFPFHSEFPLRIEFRADTLHKLRYFNPESQRSFEDLTQATVIPLRELIEFETYAHPQQTRDHGKQKLLKRALELETPKRELNIQAEAFETSAYDFPGIELVQIAALDGLESFFKQMPADECVVVADDIGVAHSLDRFSEMIDERYQRLTKEHFLSPEKSQIYLSPESLQNELEQFAQYRLDRLNLMDLADQHTKHLDQVQLHTEFVTKLKSQVGTGQTLSVIKEFIRDLRRDGYSIAFAVGSEGRADRLRRMLLEADIEVPPSAQGIQDWIQDSNRPPLIILSGSLSSGFKIPSEKIGFIAESEIFRERSAPKRTKSAANLRKVLSSLAQLKPGDYVVHIDYGIGVYRGLKHLEVEGFWQDLLQIDYADSRLYLPTHNITKVQKFVAEEGKKPVIDQLGSTRWAKTKEKVKNSLVTLAADLIKLYATRSISRGWRFEPFGAEDERFSDGFPYSETPDQRKAIEDTLTDMASERPMERLVCGDVGFGKTEVALRAAFKSTQHAKQVAILAPTTLLVEQHKEVFSNRFLEYPVKISAISRFYTVADNKQTLERLASGELDIIIGTHRLLQSDVHFHDLGLVIVDEEHRFGVKQKEKLKQLRKQVDVLTLTATPIPRTLHMALLGIRDISIISTPPQNRKLIRTYVAAHDGTLVRDAVVRELQRGGQCFYVRNRIEGIEISCAELRKLVPEARFEFAHGQMHEAQLEKIMARFLKHEIDVLISTTIIESGLDIPDANTIIIERADTFGLAQLYQLRGRVGRSPRQAYAYFLIPKSAHLSEEAHKRLRALQSLDDLGQGFNLALRDLEIRGAGNLLGKEQSGNVLMVGFELYNKILRDAVLHLSTGDEEFEDDIDPELKIHLEAYIPQSFVADVSERLVWYQRLASSSENEMDLLIEELVDRFGDLPRPTETLVGVMRLRALFRRNQITKAELAGYRLSMSFSRKAKIDLDAILKITKSQPERFKFNKNLTLAVNLEDDPGIDLSALYSFVDQLLSQLRVLEPTKPEAQKLSLGLG